MSKIIVTLMAFFAVSSASAHYCDQYEFGSSDWWTCVSSGGAPLRTLTTMCGEHEFGSQAWWDCIQGLGPAPVNMTISAQCEEHVFGSTDWWACQDFAKP